MPKPAQFVTPKNFESALAELESLVQTMESGKLDLEESLDAYQRGAQLLKYCQTLLDDAEQRISVLDGEVLTELPSAEAGET